MSNKKTSDELSGYPIKGADLFRIARGTDNYKLTSDEVFSDTLTKAEAITKLTNSELIVGRVYKITSPSTAYPAISAAYLTAIAANKLSPEATVMMIDGGAYEAFYDFALDTFGYVNVTHATLRNLCMNSQLVPGITYRITDYKSVNVVNSAADLFLETGTYSSDDFDYTETYTSSVEVLRIKAISDSQLEHTASSESYPQDVLEYDVYANSICRYVEYQNGYTLPNGNTVTNFDLQWDAVNNQVYIDMPTGYPIEFSRWIFIYFSINGSTDYESRYIPYYPNVSTPAEYFVMYPPLGPSVSYSHNDYSIKVVNNGTRIILEGLTYGYYTNYDADSLYVENAYKYEDSYGHVTRRIDTKAEIDLPVDFRNYKYRRYAANVIDSDTVTTLYTGAYLHADIYCLSTSSQTSGKSSLIQYNFNVSKLCPIFPDDKVNNLVNRLSNIKIIISYYKKDLSKFYFDNVVFNCSTSLLYSYISNFNAELIYDNANADYVYFANCTFYDCSIYDLKLRGSGLYNIFAINSEFTTFTEIDDIMNTVIVGTFIEKSKFLWLSSVTFYDNSIVNVDFKKTYINDCKFYTDIYNTINTLGNMNTYNFTTGSLLSQTGSKFIVQGSDGVNYVSYYNGTTTVYDTPINS